MIRSVYHNRLSVAVKHVSSSDSGTVTAELSIPSLANECEDPIDSERSLVRTQPSSVQRTTTAAHDDEARYNQHFIITHSF